ncbi:hypothetical protein D1646_01165 [Pseudoflavonifractor sp. 60]|uniref:hypothetical protein n=1 Tax=Pseudoflavonifractor sp. 60 TaxID=2304576 RepID=UPI0013684FBB|nr:hypothetical protein [Pseudoflavonifractor sp. 60]NBI65436.1 hypothetical protein [Pseudoflavonifractor sp. 60]
MIDLERGTVSLRMSRLTLGPELTLEEFQAGFPCEQIWRSWRPSTGYTWFYLCDRVFAGDKPFLIDLCFTPDGQLSMVDLYPHLPRDAPKGEPGWSPEAGQRNKQLCDRWLEQHCGPVLTQHRLHTDSRAYLWGELTTYWDPRGGSSGICLGYHNTTTF